MTISITRSMKPRSLDRSTITRISLFILLNAIDVMLTTLLIQTGLGREVNPLLASSPYRLAAIKGLLVFLILHCYGRQREMMHALNIGMTLVISWNLFWLVVL